MPQLQSIQDILPPEVLITISDFLASLADLNALARTNKSFYNLLNTRLYKHDVTDHNASALTWAATHDKESTARRSLAADADQHVKGCTPLLLATYHGSIDVLQMLLGFEEVDPNRGDSEHFRPPLSWAVRQGHSGIVHALLNDPRVDVNLQDKRGNTPFMFAANKHSHLIPVLLQRGHADPRIRNNQHATPLSRASRQDIEETDMLLAAHIQLIQDGDDSSDDCQYVFFHAAITGSLDVVKYMVENFGEKLHPSDGNRDDFGPGALFAAAERNRVEIVRYLCGWEKTNPNLRDGYEYDTPLFSATKNGRAGIVKALLECDRTDLELGNARGTTVLGIAATKNQADIIRILLSGPRRVDPNVPNYNSHTPLYLAAWFGNLEAVEALLEAEGIDPNMGDGIDGMTPLEVAEGCGHTEVAERLEEYLAELG
jgi:ankyrin repeat protein